MTEGFKLNINDRINGDQTFISRLFYRLITEWPSCSPLPSHLSLVFILSCIRLLKIAVIFSHLLLLCHPKNFPFFVLTQKLHTKKCQT